jgi:hypothetical protein
LLDLEQLLNRKVDIAERGYVERTHSRARFAGGCTTMRRKAERLQDILQHFASKPATTRSSLNRLKKQTTIIKPIESIFISNKINRHSDGFIKSIPGAIFSRTKNLF